MGRVRPEHDIDVMEEAVDNFLVLAWDRVNFLRRGLYDAVLWTSNENNGDNPPTL